MMYKTKHAVREEWRFRFIFACFIIFSLYSLGISYTKNLKRSINDGFVESISELTESLSELQGISKAFSDAAKMTLEITDTKG